MQIVARHLERILNMLDLERRCCCRLEQDHVETAGAFHPMTLGEKLRGESHKLLLFLPMHGMNRAPELPGPARLDFDEHQHLAVFRHEVQFSQ